jgi:hypothetical protein
MRPSDKAKSTKLYMNSEATPELAERNIYPQIDKARVSSLRDLSSW